jgi:F0F1-type ATP synthase membrane subunit b/b'
MPQYKLELGNTVIVGSASDYLTFLKGCEETVAECAYMEWHEYQDILAEARDKIETQQLNDADAAHWTDKDWAEYNGESTSFTDIIESLTEEGKKEYDEYVKEQNTNNSLKY